VDGSGNAYVTGSTQSGNFTTVNPLQPNFAGGTFYGDAFVTEIAAGGQSLVYSTYLGGAQEDCGNAIAVDGAGNAYVAGTTNSTDFDLGNAVQSANAGGYDAFVTQIAPGGAMVYSTYLGGSGDDVAYSIALDSACNVYLAGPTASSDFHTANAVQPAFAGGADDVFVAKVGGLWWDGSYTTDGWMWDWIGWISPKSSHWVYHSTLGWFYPLGTSSDRVWVYDPQWDGQGGWWWTSNTFYPYIYSVTEGKVYYFDSADSTPVTRWFFDGSGAPSVH
jgi:hypothetical protein